MKRINDVDQHQLSKTKLYAVHGSMIRRVTNPNQKDYKRYKELGVTICDEWNGRKNFLNFYNWALSNGYKEGLQLDREDNNKGYTPSNCRWVTPKTNSLNRRNTVYVVYKGETKTLSQWCEELNLSYADVSRRIRKNKWSVEDAFEKPIKRTTKNKFLEYKGITKPLSQWASELGIKPIALEKRIKRIGVEKAMNHRKYCRFDDDADGLEEI